MDEQSERVASEVAVLEANHDFYRAFSEGDFDAMSRVWAVRAPVVCMHPGLPPVVGRSAVLDSWKQILPPASEWEMSCRAARAHVMGESAFVTCLEASGDKPAHLAATNVFVLEDGQWRLVHHQAGPLSHPRFGELAEQLVRVPRSRPQSKNETPTPNTGNPTRIVSVTFRVK